MAGGPQTRFDTAMRAHWPAGATRLGVAVSGGSDSTALMGLAQDWAARHSAALFVATFDHRLRDGSTQEAARVATFCGSLGLPHTVLTWPDRPRTGNLQAQARDARRGAIAHWARSLGLDGVALGHTRDDQAETFLMRLARGSGVEGLSAMAPKTLMDSVLWLRPLLDLSRADLRTWLQAKGWTWIDDPSNDNPRFDRVALRQAQPLLDGLGLTVDRLAQTAARLRDARESLDMLTDLTLPQVAHLDQGDVVFDTTKLDALPADLSARLVAQALCVTSGNGYRPRMDALRRAMGQARASLHGCILARRARSLRVMREYAAVAGLSVLQGQFWDRWTIEGPPLDGATIRALGPDGARQVHRPRSLPHAALLSSPALWQDQHLIAAPLAGHGSEYRARLRRFPPNLTDAATQ